MSYTPIDLGLPSGLLWAAENETAAAHGGAHLPFTEAIAPGVDLPHQPRHSRWEAPSREDFEELRRCCTFSWDKERNGAVVTGPNGNTLLLPATGYKISNSSPVYAENVGCYWTGDAARSVRTVKRAWAYNIFNEESAAVENGLAREDGVRFLRLNPICQHILYSLRKVRRAPSVEDVREEGAVLGDEIAEAHGHNVTYCESMDMDLIGLICDCVNDEDYIDRVFDDLRFYACHGRGLPEELDEASAEEFKEYFRKYRATVLCAAEDIIDEYRSCDYPPRDNEE